MSQDTTQPIAAAPSSFRGIDKARAIAPREPVDRAAVMRLLFVAPALIISLSVVLVPLVVTVALSLTNWDGFSSPQFVGLANFAKLFSEARFWAALRNNLLYTSLYVTFPMIFGLLIAMLLLTVRVGRTFFQVVFFLPSTIATVVLAQIWKGMIYSPTTGMFGYLQQIGVPVSNPLAAPETAVLGVLFVDMWHWWGYLTVIYLGALRQVDKSLVEAAFIDGATRFQVFTKVLLPSIRPTILFMMLMTIIWSFRVFDWIYIMTEGGPGFASEVLGTLAYKTAFQQFAVGYASSYSVMMSLVGLGAIIVYLRIQIKTERR